MSERTYQSGPFTVSTRTLQDGATSWLELELSLSSGKVRLPIASAMQKRQTELKAELACLRMLGDEITKALEAHEQDGGE